MTKYKRAEKIVHCCNFFMDTFGWIPGIWNLASWLKYTRLTEEYWND